MRTHRRALPFLFLELNAQHDFLGPRAALPLANVELVNQNIKWIRQLLQRWKCCLLSGMDAHQQTDPEFAENHLPPHALVGTEGRRPYAGAWDQSAQIIPCSGKRRPWPKIGEIMDSGAKLVLEKRQFDLFSNPASREVLKAFGCQTLYCFGATLEHDIRATALSARTLGYEVVVIGDAVGLRDQAAAEQARGVMLKRGIRFEPCDETSIQIVLRIKRRERETRQKAVHE